MKIATVGIVAFLLVSCIDTKPLFSIKEDYPRDEIKSTHKKVAILPVNYVTDANSENGLEKMMDSNTDPLVRQEEKATKYQHMIYEELSRANKQTDWLTDKVTNRLLKEKNISFQDIKQLSKAELAKQLQVDAVIYFDFVFKTESISQADAKKVSLTTDKKSVVEVTVEIYSAIEDTLIWKANSKVSRQKIYSPVLFRELIGRQLEPVLPFN